MSKKILKNPNGSNQFLDPTKPEEYNRSLIYVDNKMVMENQISIEDLLKMSEQPDKFNLSNYLKTKVHKEKVKRGLVD